MHSHSINNTLRLINERARSLEASGQCSGDPRGHGNTIVLCGAGPLGQMTLAHLRQVGVVPVAVVDNDRNRWGSDLEGVTILAPSEAVSRYAQSASFVVTIYNGSAVRRQFVDLGCVHVMHFSDIFFRYPRLFLPFCGLAQRAVVLDAWTEVAKAAHVWSDERSRAEYRAQLEWRLRLPGTEMPRHDAAVDCYFPADLFRYLDDEVVFDCGAFDGDSIRQYLARRPVGSHSSIVAFEPDAATFDRLANYVRQQPLEIGKRIRIEPWAVADKTGEVRFTALGSVRSGVEDLGTTAARAVALDDVGIMPTFIKMDVEGFELPALRGAAGILRDSQPVLAISLYHHASDLWAIPNFIKSLVPDYHLYLRRYAEDCWELILYAIPTSRLLDNAPTTAAHMSLT
jgi:FkbM family methyltransferase